MDLNTEASAVSEIASSSIWLLFLFFDGEVGAVNVLCPLVDRFFCGETGVSVVVVAVASRSEIPVLLTHSS